MADFLTRLTSFFNLQKTANIGAPGLIAALAVILIQAAPLKEDYAADTYSFSDSAKELVTSLQGCEALSRDWYANDGLGGRVTAPDWKTLQRRRAELDDCAYQLHRRVIADQAIVATTGADAASSDKLAAALHTQYQTEVVAGSPLAPTTRTAADQASDRANIARAGAKAAELRIALYEKLIPRLNEESKAISTIVHAGDATEPFEDVANRLGTRIMSFLLLALVCGLVIDPFMGLIQPFLHTDERVKRLNAAVHGILVYPRRMNWQIYNVNYAVGVGLLSQADVDNLRRTYLLPSQMLLNLILPIALLLVAAGLYLQTHWSLWVVQFRLS